MLIINKVKNERGVIAVFSLVALLLLTAFGIISVSLTSNDMKNTMQAIDTTQGEYIANGALLKVLDSYTGIGIQNQVLKNLYSDNNNNKYNAIVMVANDPLIETVKFKVVAIKNTKAIYSISANVKFFKLEGSTISYGYSIQSIVQERNPILNSKQIKDLVDKK